MIRLAQLIPELTETCRIAGNRLIDLGERGRGSLMVEMEAQQAADVDLELTVFHWKTSESPMPGEDVQVTANNQRQPGDR